MLRTAIIKLILVAYTVSAAAQDTLWTISYKGKLDSIESKILQQQRYIQVFLPPAFKPGSSDKYDVLYVTDGGNWNMNVVAQVQRFIQNEGHMPPTIIVSVTGRERNIELTPTVLKSWNAPTGGADKFLGYIKEELIPYINKNYPSNGENSIWGHSLGGMFVTYVMLKEPTLFKSYIAADPSLWWDDAYVPKLAATRLAQLKDSAITYFMSGRQGLPFHEMKVDTMEILLKKYAPANLRWKSEVYENETHSSLRMKTTYDGLKFAYEGMTSSMEMTPMNGMVMKNKPYKIVYTDDSTHVHYTIDGTAPTEQSPQVTREVVLTGPAMVTYRRISHRERYSRSITGSFTDETLAAPVLKLKNARAGGLEYLFYESGTTTQRPDLTTLLPSKKGIYNKDFSADSLHRKSNYAMVMKGWLEVKEEGYYTFFLRAGKGSSFSINGRQIMHWDDNDKREVFSYLLPLTKGFYPVRIDSFDKKDDYNLLLYYLTPSMPASGDPVPIPFEVLNNGGKK